MHPRFRSYALACMLMSLSALPAAALEFDVTTKFGWQQCPAAVAGPAGDYMVVFASHLGHSGDPQGVLAQRIGPFGEKIGPELSLDITKPSECLTAVPSGPGRFLVVWGVYKPLSLQTIYARHFDFQGNPVGPKFQAGEGFAYLQPGAACDSQGRCWISWIGQGVDGVYMRRFNLSGEPLGAQILVDTPGEGERYYLQVATDSQDNFTVAWWNGDTSTTPDNSQPPAIGQIHVRRFSAAGEPLGNEILVGTDPAFAYHSPAICHGAAGSFFVSGIRERKDDRSLEVFLQRFDGSGTPAGAPVLVAEVESTWSTELACRPDGSALLLWAKELGINPDLFGRFFSPAGEPTGAPFLVSAAAEQASAVVLGPGRFLVAWANFQSNPSGYDVFGRVYNPESQLPLRQGRFQIEAAFRDPHTGKLGPAHFMPLTDETGLLWFFSSSNVELVVKMLDGCDVNGHYWFFAAGLTDVEVEITVTDSTDGSQKQYRNPPKTAFLPIQDTRALACH